MCKELCDANDGEEQSCQRCGRLICFDTQTADDVCAPAYVTASGDVYCRDCGSRLDRLEDDEADEYCGEVEFDPYERDA
jgi:hypothetical protein